MKKISSFEVNHDKLLRGVYVSRKDNVGENILTTFDIRMKLSNIEPVLDNSSIHTLEHLMATFLRNHKDFGDKIIYLGPMGCRTGMYLILNGNYESENIINLLKETFLFVVNFNDKIPATTSIECGNYLEHNLNFAKWEAKNYLENTLNIIEEKNMIYPE